MKYFRMSYDEVVFKRSYINLLLLNAAIPGIKPFEEDENNTSNTNTSENKNKPYTVDDNGNGFFTSLM